MLQRVPVSRIVEQWEVIKEQLERIVPHEEFNSNELLFQFQNETAHLWLLEDENEAILGYGVTKVLLNATMLIYVLELYQSLTDDQWKRAYEELTINLKVAGVKYLTAATVNPSIRKRLAQFKFKELYTYFIKEV